MSTAQDLIVPDVRAERARSYSPPATVSDGATIMQIIERMSREATFNPVAIREMLAIKKEYEAEEARKAFMADMAAFKENVPTFFKTKHADYGSGKAKFDYAPLAEVVSKIVPALAANGLSHNWIPKFENGVITVKCVLTHRLGHSISIESPPVPPDATGGKSPSQAIQATITFWQRTTLQAITGTAAGDLPDLDDGAGRGDDTDDDRPALAEDVKIALKDASKEGSDALARCFKSLAETTRARIVADYNEEWTALKADAAKVKAS